MAGFPTQEGQPEFNAEIGATVRQMRELRGIAQQELALALGMSNTGLSHLESGRSGFSLWQILRVGRLLDVDLVHMVMDLAVPGVPLRDWSLLTRATPESPPEEES